jgi:hypothetical protein
MLFFYKEFSRIILTVFIIFRFPHSFFLSELNCVNRYSKSDFPRSKKHNPSQGKKLQTLELHDGGWFLSRKFQTSFIKKKNVSLGAARDPPHIPKNRSRFKGGVSGPWRAIEFLGGFSGKNVKSRFLPWHHLWMTPKGVSWFDFFSVGVLTIG